ncbi:FecR family protein [Salmonirosea aquatica]|uniref:DUF4974 domain-containing protein n=1 Tax=Salmonirosea aquatica TaxID=2654236 RepID=A0A7C9FBV8_9BACT|nr:DUF4974 domain-containing protein [Cytophagaceae bacterium SJW1-29]
MSKNPVSYELLDKYLAGRCTAEEVYLVEKWYASLDEEGSLPADEKVFDQPKQWARVRAALRDHMDNPAGHTYTPAKSKTLPLWPNFSRIAAAVLLLLGVLGGYRYWQNTQDDERMTTVGVSAPETVRIENTLNRIVRHSLPDGSEIWLNPGASIRYAKLFQSDFRDVSLEGEAFFEVTPNPSRPFRVSSGKMLTTVLGTSFNVKANPIDQQYEVSVVTGKVSVSAPDPSGRRQSVQLLPRQQAIIDATSGQLAQKELPASAGKVASWQPVSLTFQDATLGEVVSRLEKKFDLKITLANPRLANCRIKAVFDQQRLPEILDMTTLMVEATYEMQGNTIILTGAGCPE